MSAQDKHEGGRAGGSRCRESHAAGTVITAITGLLVVLNQAGLVGGSDSTATPSSTATGVSPPTSETAAIASPPTSEHQTSVPGTDAQGFKDYPGARCDPGNPLAAIGPYEPVSGG